MNNSRLVAGAIVAIAALIAIGLTVYYVLFAQPGRQRHDSHLNEDTAVRIVFQPAREQRYISSLTSSATRFIRGVPRVTSMQARAFRVDGIHTLPYELTLLVERPDEGAYPATLFLNPLPESEGLLHELDRPSFFHYMRFAQWTGTRFRKESEQVYTAEGRIQANAGRIGSAPTGAPTIQGNHLFEGVGDNRNGAVSALLESVTRAYGAMFDRQFYDAAWYLLEYMASIKVSADLGSADQLDIHFSLDALPQADMGPFLQQCEQATDSLAQFLEHRGNLQFTGTWKQEGMRRAEGVFRLRGWETHLRRLLGG